MICFKLYATADQWPGQSRHLADLRALAPTRDELLSAARWARTHDPSHAFRGLLVAVLARMGVEDADAALDANRAGHLSPDQAVLYRQEAASDRRTALLAGVAIAAFGAVIVGGTLLGRVPGGRLESFLVGAALVGFGVVVAYFAGIRASRRKAAAADAGRVTMIEGPFARVRRDRGAGLFGEDTSHTSPGNEYEYFLYVGERELSVSEQQYAAAPDDGVVRVYLLGDSDRIVNLERIADGPPPQVPAIVRAALERAAESGDPEKAAQARAMLRQAEAMSGASAGASAAPSTPGVGLDRLILGAWHSDMMRVTYEFHADGSVVATAPTGETGTQRWSLVDAGTITLADSTVPAAVDGDTFTLGGPPRAMTFMRVGAV